MFVFCACVFVFKVTNVNHATVQVVSHLSPTFDFQRCGMRDLQSLRLACAYAQSDQSLCQSLAYCASVKLLTEHHLEFLRLKGGCTGSS